MNKRLITLREELAEFRAAYAAERRNYPGGWVPGRMLPLSGLMLRELTEDGMIQDNGRGEFRP